MLTIAEPDMSEHSNNPLLVARSTDKAMAGGMVITPSPIATCTLERLWKPSKNSTRPTDMPTLHRLKIPAGKRAVFLFTPRLKARGCGFASAKWWKPRREFCAGGDSKTVWDGWRR